VLKKLERYFTVGVILTAVFASLSCSLGLSEGTDTPAPPAANRASEIPPAGSALPQLTQTLPPTTIPTRPEATPLSTPPPLGELGGSAANIDSFSMSLVFQAEGVDSKGKPYTQTFSYTEDSIKSQKSNHIKVSGLGSAAGVGLGDMDIYQVTAGVFMYSAPQNGENPSCLALGSGQSTFDPNSINPAGLMKNITVDQLIARGEMVNGVLADHYTVKNADMGWGEATSQSGDVWLAQDGGYAVKFTGQAQGTFDIVTTFTGSITWNYDLTNVNQVNSIVLPPECTSQQNLLSDYVFPPNTTDLSQSGNMTVFSSLDKPADVSAFLQKNLPDKGWTIDLVDASTGSDITILISKAGKKMQITITSDSSTGGCSVFIAPAQ
jgi:hypothetical protein